ncbi:hypothetical protein [Mesorhizobium liriopis]|nr:hypothetical protein [Mesorhizobium liriopis]
MSSDAAMDSSTRSEATTAEGKQELIKAATDKILSLRGKTTE